MTQKDVQDQIDMTLVLVTEALDSSQMNSENDMNSSYSVLSGVNKVPRGKKTLDRLKNQLEALASESAFNQLDTREWVGGIFGSAREPWN